MYHSKNHLLLRCRLRSVWSADTEPSSSQVPRWNTRGPQSHLGSYSSSPPNLWKKTSFYNHVISLVMTSRPWLDLKHSLAFVGVGVEGMLVRVLGVPRLTRDPRRGLVDLTAVVFSTATETVGGEAGALAFLHPDFSWAEEPNSRSVNSHLCHWITKM